MSFNMSWLSYTDLPKLSELDGADNTTSMFLSPFDYQGSDQRMVLGTIDENDDIQLAIGVRKLLPMPIWILEWVLTNPIIDNFQFLFDKTIVSLCKFMEGIGYNEFMIIDTDDKNKQMLSSLEHRYWSFVDVKIPAGFKTDHSLHWSIMKYQLYNYDIQLRRYILKR